MDFRPYRGESGSYSILHRCGAAVNREVDCRISSKYSQNRNFPQIMKENRHFSASENLHFTLQNKRLRAMLYLSLTAPP